jgi:hypothetical protein
VKNELKSSAWARRGTPARKPEILRFAPATLFYSAMAIRGMNSRRLRDMRHESALSIELISLPC